MSRDTAPRFDRFGFRGLKGDSGTYIPKPSKSKPKPESLEEQEEKKDE